MRHSVRHASTLVLSAVTALAACSAGAAPTPTSTVAPTPRSSAFSIGADTGSVPPPFNYTYTIDASFQGAALKVRYVLAYQFRDQLTTAETTSQGYTLDDNIIWSGSLTGPAFDAWRTVIANTTLGPIPPLAPGAASFSVSLTPPTGQPQVGVPVNRDDWQALITSLDRQARTETGAKRTKP